MMRLVSMANAFAHTIRGAWQADNLTGNILRFPTCDAIRSLDHQIHQKGIMAKKQTGKSSDDSGSGQKSVAFKISSAPVVHGKIEEDAHKFEVARGDVPTPAYENLGELPASYGEDVLYLVARDPHWLFSYWDVDWSRFPATIMRGGERKVFLKVKCGEAEESHVEIHPEARNWYVPAQKTNAFYRAELGYFTGEGTWQPIVLSNNALTPSDSLAQESAASFATIPLHLNFQRLVDMLQTQMGPGEGLAAALGRLQSAGSQIAFALGTVRDWTEEQRRIAAALLGRQLDDASFSSAETEQMLRRELREKLQSPGGSSEIFAKSQWEIEASSLFSGIGAWKPETSSLFSAIGGVWRQELTSLFSAIGAFGSAGAWGPGVSSLSSAGWGPLASSLSSGIGASWSAQPFGQPRDFFMHVNAEVIFYGGTHPDAKVWIDGKPVKLQPDGTFHHHFRFPDGDHEIPIVAQSPDGVEQRSATLRFQRGTARQGEVGATAQPAHLGEPMGKK